MFAKSLLCAVLLAQQAFALTESLLFDIPSKDIATIQQSSAAILKCVGDFKGAQGIAAGPLVEEPNKFAVLIDWKNEADAAAAKKVLQRNKPAYRIFNEHLIEGYLYAFERPAVPLITKEKHIVERYTSTLGPSVTPASLKSAVDILGAFFLTKGYIQVATSAIGHPNKLLTLVPWESTAVHEASRNSPDHIEASAPSYALEQSDYYGTHINATVYKRG